MIRTNTYIRTGTLSPHRGIHPRKGELAPRDTGSPQTIQVVNRKGSAVLIYEGGE